MPFDLPALYEQKAVHPEQGRRVSISGVQEKFPLRLDGSQLRLAAIDEQGIYILKPISSVNTKANQLPANEHLTMQLARQVFDLETAENALIFFHSGAAAWER